MERQREREREKERERDTEKETERRRRRERVRGELRYDIFRFTSPESNASSCIFHGRLIQGQVSNRIHHDPWASSQNGLNVHCLLLILLNADWLLSSTDRRTLGFENFRHYIFFRLIRNSSYATHVAFPLSFVYLKARLHIPFCNPQIIRLVKSQNVTIIL